MNAVAAHLPPGSFADDPAVARILDLLSSEGDAAYVVGGAVRNALLGLQPGDIDIATTAEPPIVVAKAQAAGLRSIPTGIEHGTVTVLIDHRPFEVTTLRRDVETYGRRATVSFSRDIGEDAQRRDFTMNALYARADGAVLDPVGGLPDLHARRVRFIGDARTRIREDYLRILRLFRFHAEYGEGPLDPQARDAAVALRGGLERLSAERIRAEWLKLLAARRAAEVVPAVAEAGFAQQVLGGVARLAPFARLLAGCPAATPIARLAALALHGSHDVQRLRDRLRLSGAEAQALEQAGLLIDRLHGRAAALDVPGARRLVHELGSAEARNALCVAMVADGLDVAQSLAAVAPGLDAPRPRSPWSGAHLIARGVPPGPGMGAILAAAEAAWRDEGFPDDAVRQNEILDDILERRAGEEPPSTRP
ncbi:CCA tRNA nucleotidyltransferase [uncultured Alsobacter sp.]|uniref:CCA tRNA nucleotidyltransferase n=1 Tax=uncultured Alsobacter sp. TaxID=1748258 RepID=UPI0025D710A4|nr:CCA tRNA nucleotidyltransferase [uncultured Alsobacter sp.]